MGRGAHWRDDQQGTLAHKHHPKPLNHSTVVGRPLFPLRFNTLSTSTHMYILSHRLHILFSPSPPAYAGAKGTSTGDREKTAEARSKR